MAGRKSAAQFRRDPLLCLDQAFPGRRGRHLAARPAAVPRRRWTRSWNVRGSPGPGGAAPAWVERRVFVDHRPAHNRRRDATLAAPDDRMEDVAAVELSERDQVDLGGEQTKSRPRAPREAGLACRPLCLSLPPTDHWRA